jgi:hypothetical protein
MLLAISPGVVETWMPGTSILSPAPCDPVDRPVFPGTDTLRWCDYNSNNTGYTIAGSKAGFGVRFKADHYPAVVSGVYHRVFRLRTDKAVIRIVDDDGSYGGPGTIIYEADTTLLPYTTDFHYNALPAPNCTIWDGDFYLFILSGEDTTTTLNWLHDGARSAPDSIHWRYDGSQYYLFGPSGDMQMCAVIECHDVSVDSVSGFPENDTVYAESLYTVRGRCLELAGFAEDSLPVVLSFGDSLFDTAYVDMAGMDTVDAVFPDFQPALPPGEYECACFALLASDARPENDTIRFQLTVCPTSGIEEENGISVPVRIPGIVGSVLELPRGKGGLFCWRLLDTSGREVAELHQGRNDVSRVPAGVYFVRQEHDRRFARVVIKH